MCRGAEVWVYVRGEVRLRRHSGTSLSCAREGKALAHIRVCARTCSIVWVRMQAYGGASERVWKGKCGGGR